jgi:hypothetical protein
MDKPSAESATQQSPGRKPREGIYLESALKGRHSCYAAPSGLIFPFVPTQGFGRRAASALGFAVSRFQRWTLAIPRLQVTWNLEWKV